MAMPAVAGLGSRIVIRHSGRNGGFLNICRRVGDGSGRDGFSECLRRWEGLTITFSPSLCWAVDLDSEQSPTGLSHA
jgi:hypothetical protein